MRQPTIITLVALFWIGMVAVLLFADAASQPSAVTSSAYVQPPEVIRDSATQADRVNPPSTNQILPADLPAPHQSIPVVKAIPVTPTPAPVPDLSSSQTVLAPYKSYILTQGPHGFSYGHAAIDLTAGNGAEIMSPISGTVTQLFTDYLGNPTLVIENDLYQVTLMHGNYTVSSGMSLAAGQLVGYESNNGNTVDWAGRSCRGRDCGYHTHLNIYDKRTGENANPLLLIITPGQ